MPRPSKNAYSYALSLLARRDYSLFGLKTKLKSKSYTEEEISQTIEDLKAKNYLREENYIQSKIKYLLKKNYSPFYIEKELAKEQIKVNKSQILEVASSVNCYEEDQIKTLFNLKSRLLKPNQKNCYNKLLSSVIQKGHDLQLAKKILKDFLPKTTHNQYDAE
ncbi:MAG: regulatory protein RecX [Bacteriovoracaceae bacterium]|nr:regulatory protein RecX [Bacteriovoracaceae bacterium]